VIESGKPSFHCRADGTKHEYQGKIQVTHQGPAERPAVIVISSDVECHEMHYSARIINAKLKCSCFLHFYVLLVLQAWKKREIPSKILKSS